MNTDNLRNRLLNDLKTIGMPVEEVNVYIRPYSKTYYGNYFPKYDKEGKPRIYLYPFKNTEGELYSYSFLVDTFIHEMCHHLEYMDNTWKRVANVMHDEKFWRLYNKFMFIAKLLGVIEDGYKSEAA